MRSWGRMRGGGGMPGMMRPVANVADARCRQRRRRHAEPGLSPDAICRRTQGRRAAHFVIACVFLASVVLPAAAHAQSNPEARKTMGANRFDFRYFETLPEDRRIPEAQAEVERLFPPGSKAKNFESYFIASGARCQRATDYFGPAVSCIYSRSGLSFVSTDWTVVARLDSTFSRIISVSVHRYLTGL